MLTSFRLDSSKKVYGNATPVAATGPVTTTRLKASVAMPAVRPDPVLGILALVYVMLPTSMAPTGVSTPEQALIMGAGDGWLQHLARYISDLSVRLSVLWIGNLMTWWAAGGDGLLMLYLFAIYLTAQNPSDKKRNDKRANMHTMFSLLCSQQVVGLLQGTIRILFSCPLFCRGPS